ncbi:hypothetical protein [Nocardia grenadensis]|uniref:hypothetical protein n=1 Tax=Nocardia grenadensis TaxID=931537 RepID=UPI003D8B076A
MNSIDTFTTTATDLATVGRTKLGRNGVFVDIDDVEYQRAKGKRAVKATQYRQEFESGKVVVAFGAHGERTYAPDDMVTWHVIRQRTPPR